MKTFDGSIREIVKQRVAVVDFGGDKGIGKNCSRVGIQRFSNLAEQTDLVERGAADVRDVLFVGEVRIKFNSKVTSMGAWRNG